MLAIADTVIPTIEPIAKANTQIAIAATDNEYSTAKSLIKGLSADTDAEAVATTYLQENASSNPAFRESLHRLFAVYMPQKTRKELGTILNILE